MLLAFESNAITSQYHCFSYRMDLTYIKKIPLFYKKERKNNIIIRYLLLL